jgi:hypothetical protein
LRPPYDSSGVDDTYIEYAALQADLLADPETARPRCRFMDVTDEEIAAARAFAFPAVCEPAIEIQYAAISPHCECGKLRQTTVAWPDSDAIVCACGQRWRASVAVESGSGGRTGHPLDDSDLGTVAGDTAPNGSRRQTPDGCGARSAGAGVVVVLAGHDLPIPR